MQDLLEIKVESYSGYKADESPRRFYIGDMRFEIESITDRWYQAGPGQDFPPANYFRVQTRDNKEYILKHEYSSNRWYLVIKGESITISR
jgi:hypothetical protein